MLKKILKDCLPTIFSLMMLALYGVTDGIFIGNSVGDIGLAAINIAWPVASLITAIGVGIGVGGSVLISHKHGQGDEQSAEEIFHTTLTILLGAGLLMTALLLPLYPQIISLLGANGATYGEADRYTVVIVAGAVFQMMSAGLVPILRNYNRSMHAMLCLTFGTLLNIGINYWLICVKNMGIQGAAYGTIIAQCVVAVLSLGVLLGSAKISVRLRLEFAVLRQIFKVGATAFGLSFAPSITLIFTNLQCLAYGGEGAVACYAVVAYIAFPVQSMLTGVGDGTQPLMSYYSGAKQQEQLKQVVRIAKLIALVLSLALMAITLALVPYIGGWFGLSAEGLSFFDQGMILAAIAFPFIAFVKFNLCYLNATLQTKTATLLTYLESLVISPMLLVLLPLLWDVNGIWLSYPATALVILYLLHVAQQFQKSHPHLS